MPRATQNKLYQSFVKGLITEAGPLTYPENASTDELNTIIKFKGSRSRRLGLDYEPSSAPATISDLTNSTAIAEYAWKSVGNNATINFLVMQVNTTIHFFNMDAVPVTGSPKSFTVNLDTFKASYASTADIGGYPVQMASGKGYLFIVSPFMDPLVVEYDSAGDTISVLNLVLKVRDFIGVDDTLSNEDQPATLSNTHYYNLRNQGWVQPGPNGVVDGTPTTTYTGTPPSGSSSGTGGGGQFLTRDGSLRSVVS